MRWGRGAALPTVLVIVAAACSGGSSGTATGEGADAGAAAEAAARTEARDDGATTNVASESGRLRVETTSTRAAFVSGGDVLLTVSGDAADALDTPATISVTVDGDDRPVAFTRTDDGWRGVLDGLAPGERRVDVTAGDETAALTVTNHPKNGPVFSGPHIEPWVCTTEAHGLGPPTDDDCDAPTQVTWSYVTSGGEVRELDDPSTLPGDVATTTVNGTDVPFVIRTEVGVIDRGVYRIWVLDPEPSAPPAGSDPADAPWAARGWNGRLVYRFGGGCGTQYSQGANLGVDLDVGLLGRGYALVTNTLNTLQTACNTTLSAEAALMTREHFVERYGVPELTIGDGGSGGAIQQLAIAHNYPGILDALSPSVPFPDVLTTAGGVTDCGLLLHYYRSERGAALTDAQKAAINGHATTGTCESWERLFLNGIDPTTGCTSALADQVYDPETNPDGVRCTVVDMNVNVLGRDTDTGFARRPLDNVGMEYGLQALRDGVISVDEFLDLNQFVGGYDVDGNVVAERTAIDEDLAAHVYRIGAVIGPGPLDDVPILLRNVYTDPFGDIHTRYHLFSIRERLRVDGADPENLLLWTFPAGSGDLGAVLLGAIGDANDPIALLDEWLTTGERPAGAQQRCALPDGEIVTGGWEIYDEPGPCADAYPVFGDPRTAAGQPIVQDVIKCPLVPVDPDAYGVAFTDAQAQRLARVFPDGVCDWSQRGVGQQPRPAPGSASDAVSAPSEARRSRR